MFFFHCSFNIWYWLRGWKKLRTTGFYPVKQNPPPSCTNVNSGTNYLLPNNLLPTILSVIKLRLSYVLNKLCGFILFLYVSGWPTHQRNTCTTALNKQSQMVVLDFAPLKHVLNSSKSLASRMTRNVNEHLSGSNAQVRLQRKQCTARWIYSQHYWGGEISMSAYFTSEILWAWASTQNLMKTWHKLTRVGHWHDHPSIIRA